MKLISAAAIATVWMGSAHAVSADDQEAPYIGGAYLFEIPDSARDSEVGQGFQAQFGWPLSGYGFDRWAAEVTLHTLSRDRDIDGKSDYQTGLMLDLVYDFGMYGWDESNPNAPRFKPFVLAGLGVVQDDVRGDDHNHFGINVGGGALFPLDWHNLAARFEGRILAQDNDKSVPSEDLLIDYRLTFGLQWAIGGYVAASEPVIAPVEDCELAVVDPVTGRSDCGLDSDRDGVLDSLDQCPSTQEGATVDARGCPVDLGGDVDADGVPDEIDQCPDTAAGVEVDVNGCVVAQTLVLRGVGFENDSAVLTEDARAILDDVAASLRSQPNVKVEIGGHTDDIGNDAYNHTLSEQRAESVRQYLIARGIDPNRLVAVGYGEFNPIASNETAAGRAENRRVEFKLIVE
ncbi:MAG: OmpA family protein [Nevskiales bacterium]|nr:OmpA family protein [Nevskiales bacterium]